MVKLVIFDFDGTLAIHQNHDYIERRERNGLQEYFAEAFKHPDTFYETFDPCVSNPQLVKMVELCRTANIPMCCVSGMKSSLHKRAKEAFIHKHYGKDIPLIVAADGKNKPFVAGVLSRVFELKHGEVLELDDEESVIKAMREDDFLAVTPKSIAEKFGDTLVSDIEAVAALSVPSAAEENMQKFADNLKEYLVSLGADAAWADKRSEEVFNENKK